MRKLWIGALIASLGAVANPAAAAGAKFDGSTPLLCVPIEITECDVGGKCYVGTAEEVNLPQFIRIDLKEKLLRGVGEAADRTTPIDFLERENGRIVLHGGQKGRGWTAVISEETGKLSATISDEGTAFIIFGACTAL
ncbi:MAG TPA: hypothetical protein VK603_16155 [Candidatus Saccharimonadales bacterium]|nr:hypothetical protein [Candidatus Saccharimonadales bacterium]